MSQSLKLIRVSLGDTFETPPIQLDRSGAWLVHRGSCLALVFLSYSNTFKSPFVYILAKRLSGKCYYYKQREVVAGYSLTLLGEPRSYTFALSLYTHFLL